MELYIDVGDQDGNKGLFDALRARAGELVGLGDDLSWQRLDNRRASRVATYQVVPTVPPLDENPALAAWAVETMVRWNDVLRGVVADLEPADTKDH